MHGLVLCVQSAGSDGGLGSAWTSLDNHSDGLALGVNASTVGGLGGPGCPLVVEGIGDLGEVGI